MGFNIGSSRKYLMSIDYIFFRSEYDRKSECRSWIFDRFLIFVFFCFIYISFFFLRIVIRSFLRVIIRSFLRVKIYFDILLIRFGLVFIVESGYKLRIFLIFYSYFLLRSFFVI